MVSRKPAVLTLACAFLSAGIAVGQDAKAVPDGARGAAFTYAKRFITPTLKDPSSASFDWSSVSVERVFPVQRENADDAQIIVVTGGVRAKNSFNAVVPSKWRVVMMQAGDDYEAMIVTNDDAVVLKTERGQKFLDTVAQVKQEERKAKDALAAEAKRLKAARDAGRTAGTDAVKRFGRNIKTVSAEVVERNAASALKKAGIAADDEADQFLSGFNAAVQDAQAATAK